MQPIPRGLSPGSTPSTPQLQVPTDSCQAPRLASRPPLLLGKRPPGFPSFPVRLFEIFIGRCCDLQNPPGTPSSPSVIVCQLPAGRTGGREHCSSRTGRVSCTRSCLQFLNFLFEKKNSKLPKLQKIKIRPRSSDSVAAKRAARVGERCGQSTTRPGPRKPALQDTAHEAAGGGALPRPRSRGRTAARTERALWDGLLGHGCRRLFHGSQDRVAKVRPGVSRSGHVWGSRCSQVNRLAETRSTSPKTKPVTCLSFAIADGQVIERDDGETDSWTQSNEGL